MSVITLPRSGATLGTPSPPNGGGVPPAPPPPPLQPTPEPPRRPRWRWPRARIVLGALIVVLCAAGGSAVFVLEQVQSLSDALRQNSSLKVGKGVLSTAGFGGPETLLLVGDDTRRGFKYYHGVVPDLANEMLLVRLDPAKPYISLMSIPRELQAMIYPGPGRGLPFVNRLNEAYHFGIGPLVTSINRDIGVSIDHVIVATFASFKRAVDEMGCVYSTVDQRYYNLNLGTPGTNYQSIDLQPGYQKMCGAHALQFVSFRHTDTSLVRDARDQSFLLDVKKEYGPTLINNVGKFERIFGQAVRTDPGLSSATGLLDLLGTLINMAGRHVRQVHFQATLQASFDTATPQQIQASVNNFLYGPSQVPSANSVAAQAHAVHSKRAVARLPLTPSPASALAQARATATRLPGFPLEFPRVEDRGGSVQAPMLRTYNIPAPDGTNYPAYVAVFYDGGLGQYYDVQGTTWTTAPVLDSPDYKIQVAGRTYYLFYESSNLRMIAWYEHNAVYWVRNTLTNSVPSGEMLAIAEQTAPFTVAGSGPQHTPVILQAAHVPFPAMARKPVPLRVMIGGVAALVTLFALPLLLFLGVRRFADLRGARMLLDGGEQIGQRLPVIDAGATSAGPSPVPLLAPQLAFADAGMALPRRTVRWVGSPTVYRRFSLSRLGLIASLLVVVALAGGAAAAVMLTRASPQPTATRHVKRVARPLVPSVPVAVLNATTTPGAAGKLAASLRADRIKVTNVGNLVETLPPGDEILYAPGERAQAKLLAHLLGRNAPAIAPMDPVVAGAAGPGARLAVVIT